MSAAAHTQESNDRGKTVRQKQTLFWRLFGAFARLVVLILAAWLFSIVVEWIGMIFFWPEQGVEHSRQMILTELGYLNESFTHRFMGSTPVSLAIQLSSSFQYWVFEWTRLTNLMEWSMTPPADASTIRMGLADIAQFANEYFSSAMNSTRLLGVRLAVAALSSPAFIMVGIAALIDGLVERELRRYGGGNESSFVYHNVKSWMRPAVVGALFIYLGMPVSVHPNLIFIPAVVMYGSAVYLTSATFKKYL